MPDRGEHLEREALIVRFIDGLITEAEFDQLEQLLETDPAARTLFVELTAQSQSLREVECSDVSAAATPSRPPSERAALVGRSNPRRITPIALSIAAGLLLCAAAFAIYVFVVSGSPSPVPSERGPSVATLIESTGTVLYDDDIAIDGGEYASGTYSIETGSAQFVLRSRVTVDLSGKTSLRIHDSMHTSLDYGVAAFVCPTGAQGFTVGLPGGSRIVDLGTAFEVEVDADGRIRAKVTEGRIAWYPAGEHAEPVHVDSGHSLRFVGSTPIVEPQLLAAFDLNDDTNPDATQSGFTPVNAGVPTATATDGGITFTFTTDLEQTALRYGRDRGVDGSIASYELAHVLRDYTFADTDSNTRVTVELTGLVPGATYQLRWYHYHNFETPGDADNNRVAVYHDEATPDRLLFESVPYGMQTDPSQTGHTDFEATVDADGRVFLVTGAHSGGRAIGNLNGLAVVAIVEEPRSRPEHAPPTEPLTPASEAADR